MRSELESSERVNSFVERQTATSCSATIKRAANQGIIIHTAVGTSNHQSTDPLLMQN